MSEQSMQLPVTLFARETLPDDNKVAGTVTNRTAVSRLPAAAISAAAARFLSSMSAGDSKPFLTRSRQTGGE